jgi:putative methionine-R-sulfoxide reductase with GAF domain
VENPSLQPPAKAHHAGRLSDAHQTIAALTEGETDDVALMATLACEIHHADDRFDWTGSTG